MMWPPLCSLILVTLLFHCGTKSTCNPTPSWLTSPPLAPALYVFGDSLVDNGNNNLMPTVVKANYFPYGSNFNGGITGRFTNGRTVVDFFAEYLGLPYAPSYASVYPVLNNVNLMNQISTTGYNYASAASGILTETGSHLGKCITLEEQIDLFESTIRSQLAPNFKDPGKLAHHLAKSIFVFSVGSNDYINNYLNPFYIGTKRFSPSQIAHLLVVELSKKLQRMYDLGARKMMVTEVGPLGCIPTIARRVKLPVRNGKCDEEVNEMVAMFNTQLALMLKMLGSTLHDSHFILGRSYLINYDAISNPLKYGLWDGRHPCCTTWLNETYTCIPEIAPCTIPDKHFFWDGYHPTEAVYSFLAHQCIHGSSSCLPVNLRHLVQL